MTEKDMSWIMNKSNLGNSYQRQDATSDVWYRLIGCGYQGRFLEFIYHLTWVPLRGKKLDRRRKVTLELMEARDALYETAVRFEAALDAYEAQEGK